jgi:hypothetical protein
MHHSVVGNGKRDGLKSAVIGQSAAKHLIINCDMMKVQRLAERRSAQASAKCGADVKKPIEDRFFAKVAVRDSGCHEWTGCLMPNGYGQFHKDGKTAYAHRVAFELAYGATDQYVLHTCDNRKCVNPKHLFSGTFEDNMADMVAKGRQAAGDRNGRRKLSSEQVLAIRSEVGTHDVIAAKYNVTGGLVSMIRSGRIWKNV